MVIRTADVIVIGGGVIGTATAFHLAERGIKTVLIAEARSLVRVQASQVVRWASSSMTLTERGSRTRACPTLRTGSIGLGSVTPASFAAA